MKRHPHSILIAGVPLARGNPAHFEHDDDTAYTEHSGPHTVGEVHTPQDPLRRTHELMHARHSDLARQRIDYAGVIDPVRQLTEDCRIHLRHWPWKHGRTPESIAGPAREYLDWELRTTIKQLRKQKRTPAQGAWPLFAHRIRSAAVMHGMYGKASFAHRTTAETQLAKDVFRALYENDDARTAAQMIQRAFFDIDPQEKPASEPGKGEPDPDAPLADGDCSQPTMDVIELPHTEPIREAEVGTRIATSGSRIFRPALRRPVLPSRMFIRRAAVEPQGTILIDASGSMGSFSYVEDQCKAAPHATVAYYAGDGGSHGWLYVYARNGMHARELVEPSERGNTVDGPAMDWLMKQDAPRIMVTDRGFCDVADSAAQLVRLERLEAQGLITVRDYKPG